MKALYPSPAEWRGIQSGEPILFANEEATIFHVAHLYPVASELVPIFSVDLAQKIGHYGCLVDTPAVQMNRSVNDPMELIVGNALKPIKLPSVMYIERHGRPCAQRSGRSTDIGYRHIGTSAEWTNWLTDKAENNWDIWKVAQEESGKLRLNVVSSLKKALTNR
jgi:hypothetical protein